MDQMQLLLWQRMTMPTQRERSRVAHANYMRAEHARQARDARPSALSLLVRARTAFAGSTRRTVEPTALAAPRS